MAKCPECDGELVRTATKKKGMDVLKHADPAAAKAAGCGVSFIPSRSKGVVNNGGKEETPKVEKVKEPEVTEQRGGKSGYREAVASSRRVGGRGKTSGRSNRQSAQPVQQTGGGSGSGSSGKSDKPSGSFGRGFFDDVTDTIFGKRK
jgi:hypothetical protein